MNPLDTSLSARWARWGVLIAALVMGAVLLLTAWTNYTHARALSATLTRGQGEMLFESIRQALRESEGPPDEAELALLVEELGEQGLRYLAIAARPAVSSGTPLQAPARRRPANRLAANETVSLDDLGERIRMVFRIPEGLRRKHRRGGRHRGVRSSRSGRGEVGERRRWPLLPPVTIEFEPVAAAALRDQAARSLGINAAAALLLLAAAGLAFRWLRQQAAREEARRRERHLATLGEMSAVLAHEIRNPLASLKGHAQLLAEALPEDGRPKAKADRVVAEAIRLEQLTSDLLQFVRTGEIQPRPVEPALLARTAAAEQPAGRVEVDAAQAPASARLDPDRMHEVLANLLRNAIQASPADAAVHLRVAAAGADLIFEVRDHGDGIAAGEEERIFEPFHTKRVHGTGLGLAVARRVVELHGGSITASTHPEGGALLRVRVPR
ncbi:sensor histidine kinase [Haliangium ochraceum]|uniref:histidine kinase n=1 Tax=Haliangium ochraceum (strain DSM 14365 / JCM 11303 / SMP-2) TaxID=502025 RepID=D0LTN1_HALO1|nr:ATP-binding protein [Haliangium ochraceum]ACY15725.1 integral membrane sensor signal transduction histidine kinase [Haliangium ochraceum DSM 14365]